MPLCGVQVETRYDSVVAFGQSRALLIWQRIVFPDGSSIQLDNLPATDTQGYAGCCQTNVAARGRRW